MAQMTPHQIDTEMLLFDHVNIKNHGAVLFHHEHGIESDIINTTTIGVIPRNISRITFLTHGASFGDAEATLGFWRPLQEELLMAVSMYV